MREGIIRLEQVADIFLYDPRGSEKVDKEVIERRGGFHNKWVNNEPENRREAEIALKVQPKTKTEIEDGI